MYAAQAKIYRPDLSTSKVKINRNELKDIFRQYNSR